MAEEKKQFVLYEYLLYFWKQKKYFILIPLLTTLLIAGLVYAVKGDAGYTGKLLVFTGGVTTPGLTHPNNLEAEFSEVNPTVEAFVSERNQVKIVINGKTKAEVDKDLKKIVDSYMKKLEIQYRAQLDATEPTVEELEKSVETKKEALELYNSKLDGNTLPLSEYNEISDLIAETDKSLSEDIVRVHKMKGDLLFFDKPELLSQEVTKVNTYLKESIIAGLVLGLVFTFLFLILLKYIEDARRYYKHD